MTANIIAVNDGSALTSYISDLFSNKDASALIYMHLTTHSFIKREKKD